MNNTIIVRELPAQSRVRSCGTLKGVLLSHQTFQRLLAPLR